MGAPCELRHMSELPEILRRVDFDLSVRSAILAIQPTEGQLMDTMNKWEPALTKEECNNKELGNCYCGECE